MTDCRSESPSRLLGFYRRVEPSDFLGGVISGADLGISGRTLEPAANLFTRRRRIVHRTEIELTH